MNTIPRLLDPMVLYRLICKIKKTDSCWIWTGYKDSLGYGRINVNGNARLPHRVMYEIFVKKVSDDMQIDHLCRNPSCVNPKHLEDVTSYENQKRSPTSFVNIYGKKTHCPQGHPYIKENMYIGKNGARICKKCNSEKNKRHWKKKCH